MSNLTSKYIEILGKLEYFVKRIILITCFFSFCCFDQIIGSANGYIQIGYRNYIAVLLCVIILTAYKFKDFLKVEYLIWCLIYLSICFFVYDWLFEQVDNKISLKANLLLVGIVILICIRMYEYYFMEKNKLCINWTTLIVFVIMTVLMMVFRSDLVWTVKLLFVCLLLYFTDFKETDLNNLFSGMLDGIIIGFFWIQTQAWMYRPYDILRYHGMYSHPNMNALFYLCVYVALLSRWYMLKVKQKCILFRLPYIILSSIVISTMFYTGGRSAFITFIVLTLVFLLYQLIVGDSWRLVKVLANGFVLFVSITVCMLPSYWLIRYVPVYFNNPLYFEADMAQMHNKVQKNEDINSDKYIELSEAVDKMFERYLWFLDTETAEYIEGFIRDFPESFNITIQADAATLATMEVKQIEPGMDKEHPLVLSEEQVESSYDVRIDIYRYFWNKLELIGDKNNPTGVWTHNWNFAGHCHNLFLQIAYDFGIIVGVIFILLIVMIYVRIIMSLVKDRSPDNLFRMFVVTMYVTLFVVFGMFEIDWRYGQLSFTMFFIVQYVIHHKMPEPEAVMEAAPVATGQYIVPGKGCFKELVIMDLDAEDPDQESDS